MLTTRNLRWHAYWRPSRVVPIYFFILITAGCSFGPQNSPTEIPLSQQRDLTIDAPTQEPGTGVGRIYLQRTDNSGSSYLSAVQRNISSDPAVVMKVLLAGPTAAEQDQGLRNAIPPMTVQLSTRFVAVDTVKVDLSDDIFAATGDDLVSTVAQIVLTMCEIEGIAQVIIVVDGQTNEWPRGDGSLTSEALTIYDFPGRAISSQPEFPSVVEK